MTINASKLTNQTKKNHPFQCYHNNRGYCRHQEKCYYPHHKESCKNTFCRDLKCPFRHPRHCKFGNLKCKFHKKKICAYKHDDMNTNDDALNRNQELDACQIEIESLKSEISELKKNVAKKEKELEEIHTNEAEDLKSLKVLSDENIDLKAVIEKLREVNAKSLKEKDEEIDSLKFQNRDLEEKQTSIINSKSQQIIEQNNVITTKTNEIAKLRSDLACTKCDYKAETTSALISHVIMKHETREDLELSCKDCDYKCIKEFDLQLHKSAKHPGNLIAFTGFTKMKPTKSNFLYTRTNEFK